MVQKGESALVSVGFFVRASLHCVPSKPKPGFCPNTRKPRVSGAQACREQLRAGLRRKEEGRLEHSHGTDNAKPDTCQRPNPDFQLKSLFQDRLVSESGFVNMYYFASFPREIFVDGGGAFRL